MRAPHRIPTARDLMTTHLLTLHDHVAVVGGQTARRPPGFPPERIEQGLELTEVRRPLDRTGAEAELLRHGVVVDRLVTAVLLVGEHLTR